MFNFQEKKCKDYYARFESKFTELKDLGRDFDDEYLGEKIYRGFLAVNKRVLLPLMMNNNFECTFTNLGDLCKFVDEMDEDPNPDINDKSSNAIAANLIMSQMTNAAPTYSSPYENLSRNNSPFKGQANTIFGSGNNKFKNNSSRSFNGQSPRQNSQSNQSNNNQSNYNSYQPPYGLGNNGGNQGNKGYFQGATSGNLRITTLLMGEIIIFSSIKVLLTVILIAIMLNQVLVILTIKMVVFPLSSLPLYYPCHYHCFYP